MIPRLIFSASNGVEAATGNGEPSGDSLGEGGFSSFGEGASFGSATEAEQEAARAEALKMEQWWKSQENS